MSFPFSSPLYRNRTWSKGHALRAALPALTPLSIPDFRAANRETTGLEPTEIETVLVGTRPLYALANIKIIVADLKMGLVPNKKGSHDVR